MQKVKFLAAIMIGLTLSGFITFSGAETFGSIKDVPKDNISVSASPSTVAAGESTKIVFVVQSGDETLEITSVDVMSPWESQKRFAQPLTIPPNSEKIISLDLKIPASTVPDTYTVVMQVNDANGDARIVSTSVEVSKFSPLDSLLNPVLALLTAYVIPAQIIERIVELFRRRGFSIKNNDGKKDDGQKQKTDRSKEKGRLDKFHIKIDNLTDELEWWKKVKEAILQKLGEPPTQKPVDEIDKEYHDATKEIDEKIGEISLKLAKAKTAEAVEIMYYAMALAIIPAVLFSWFGLGIVQITSGKDELTFKVMDIAINALFIGSGTKPIHDIINRLKKEP